MNKKFELARRQLRANASFVIFNCKNVSCNAFGEFKKSLKSRGARANFYKTKYIKLALQKAYPSVASGIRGQCVVVGIDSFQLEVYRIVKNFLNAYSLKELALVLDYKLVDLTSSELIAKFESEAQLKTYLVMKLKALLAKLLVVLNCPLIKLRLLLNNKCCAL